MLLQDVGLVESDDKDSFIALYMFDETDVKMCIRDSHLPPVLVKR